MTESGLRTQPIEHLAVMCGASIDLDAIRAREEAAQHVKAYRGILPTIGCEVEVKWSSLFPVTAQQYFGEQDALGRFERTFHDLDPVQQRELDEIKLTHDAQLLPRYRAVANAGIPPGSDAYWEFANAPAYAATTLSQEVAFLFASGLIPEGHHHSLHITLGGLALGKGGACMVLSGLELLHGKPERFILATEGTKYQTANTWARRGQDGIRERTSDQLQLGESVATEMRTLTISSAESADHIFPDAQRLGAMLLGHRKHLHNPCEFTQSLSELWINYRIQVKDLWHSAKLPNEPWGTPHKNPTPWLRWAKTIADTADEKSHAHVALCEIQSLNQKAERLLAALSKEVASVSKNVMHA